MFTYPERCECFTCRPSMAESGHLFTAPHNLCQSAGNDKMKSASNLFHLFCLF